MLTLDIFGFQALWSPYFLLIMIVLTGGFFLLTTRFRHRFQDSLRLTKQQGALFLTSMILLYAIKGSPLDLMAHLMFYIHMIQMAALVLIVPPLFILGVPAWLWRAVLRIEVFKSLFKFFTRPLMALLIFNGLFSFYHVPIIFDHVMQNIWLHAGYSILLFVVAIFMWWPLINQLPEHQTLSGLKKVGYIFADGILLTPACALIIFAETPIYATYSDPHVWGKVMSLCVGTANFESLNLSGPELFSSMSLIHDQQLGGVLMKIMQEIIYGVILFRVFFEWYRKDQAETERDLNQKLNPSLIK
ncbi:MULTISPECIES: cytochrome c oxidase assembly factor CtaG [Neobacillus]|uniref:Cytochrome c oxidase assembly factor CtaG n=1 Tax=Neobacillus rhizophilus TaxID=2833579 RepID=A0A942YSK7_9BACI|nr:MULTISPECIES: cytochrome c oxidase assembly factor CtaG [Neobacillus]MBS4211978.1 cytochrome c oxidase assembly factor CtaG [Neobacillus rhizophilus]MBU8915409.1 cytochrome c oxidase assembly factor CtaG [Bacillus sp. FJAT-29953]